MYMHLLVSQQCFVAYQDLRKKKHSAKISLGFKMDSLTRGMNAHAHTSTEIRGVSVKAQHTGYYSQLLYSSFLTVVANKKLALQCNKLNRKFVRIDDASEETATALNVSHNSRKKLQFANPQIKIQENVARSLQKLLVFVALQQLSSYSWNRHTDRQSALPYSSCGYASRHNYSRHLTWAII